MSLGIRGGGVGRTPTLSSSSASFGDPPPLYVLDSSHRDAPEQVIGIQLAYSSQAGAQVPSPAGPVAPVLPGGSPSPCPTGGEPADPVQAGRPPGPGRQLHPSGQRLGDGAAEPAQDPLHRHPAPQLPGAPAEAQRRAAGTGGMPRGWAATPAGLGRLRSRTPPGWRAEEFGHSGAGARSRGGRRDPGQMGGFLAGRGFVGGGDRVSPPPSSPSLPAADAETGRKMGASSRRSARSPAGAATAAAAARSRQDPHPARARVCPPLPSSRESPWEHQEQLAQVSSAQIGNT